MSRHVTIAESEKISAYFAAMYSACRDQKLSRDYKLGFLTADHLIEVKQELKKLIDSIEAILSLDSTIPEGEYIDKILEKLRESYSSVDHGKQA